jgi:tripartite-type tricarboxylate transporter receptor subunit TctC
MRFLPVTTVLTVSLIGCTATLVSAQETFPSRVIRILTPATGGGSDVLARMIAPALTESLGQQVIVDNRGSLATELAAKAAPDGYTLLIDGSPLWLQPLFRKVGWNPVTDFAALTMAVSSPSMLVVHPSVPVKTLRELIALAKARPGEINYAAGSIGATPHLAGEQFKVMAGVNVVRVPYKGTGPGMIGLMGGEVEFMFPGAASAWNYVKQKRLKALAVCSLKPSALFPGVVTMSDSGLPGYESVSPQGVVVPAKTPAAIVARLHQELVKALNRAETKQRLGELGIEVVANAPEEFAASMKNDTARTAKLIKDAGIRFE